MSITIDEHNQSLIVPVSANTSLGIRLSALVELRKYLLETHEKYTAKGLLGTECALGDCDHETPLDCPESSMEACVGCATYDEGLGIGWATPWDEAEARQHLTEHQVDEIRAMRRADGLDQATVQRLLAEGWLPPQTWQEIDHVRYAAILDLTKEHTND